MASEGPYMESNLSPYDQLVRIVIGLAAGWQYFLTPVQHGWLMPFSIGFLLSGLIGICPIYALVGGSTNGARSAKDRANHERRWGHSPPASGDKSDVRYS
jgi:hypothetical protein